MTVIAVMTPVTKMAVGALRAILTVMTIMAAIPMSTIMSATSK